MIVANEFHGTGGETTLTQIPGRAGNDAKGGKHPKKYILKLVLVSANFVALTQTDMLMTKDSG